MNALSSSRRNNDISLRNKKSVVIDLRSDAGKAALWRLIEKADVLIDPYRPGVCEKLGFDPEQSLARNPRLVFARMTGWGQDGPLAQAAGHDINYIALTGALHAVGRRGERPVPPLNLVGDMGGGGMLLVSGILAALLESKGSGQGQVVDAAMVDGTAQLMWMFHNLYNNGSWDDSERETGFLDGAAYFYDTYQCADGKYIALGSIEPQFHRLLLETLELDVEAFGEQMDKAAWPEKKQALANIFLSKSRDQWSEIMEGSDICFAPVLKISEAPMHPANRQRNTYTEVDGMVQPSPAPRFSRTPSTIRHAAPKPGVDTGQILTDLGFSQEDIAAISGNQENH